VSAPSVAFSGELEQELETQYELALAYKDMYLLDAAIETFEQAMRAPNRFLDSCAMIAMCHKDRGLKRTAIEWLERALRNPRCDGALALYVKQTLAELYESEGLLQRAGELYACVPAIRDAIERMRATESDKSAGEKSEQLRKTRRRTSF
jgi:tetratricopeptide (TPR) repeat protein